MLSAQCDLDPLSCTWTLDTSEPSSWRRTIFIAGPRSTGTRTGGRWPSSLGSQVQHSKYSHFFCEAQGKGRARGGPRKVTQRSFIDYRVGCRVTRGDYRLNIGQFRLTPGHLIGQLRVGKGYQMVTVCQQG